MRQDASDAEVTRARAPNPLTRALSGLRGRRAIRRDSRAQERRQRELAQLDPDQRVRAVGEW